MPIIIKKDNLYSNNAAKTLQLVASNLIVQRLIDRIVVIKYDKHPRPDCAADSDDQRNVLCRIE